MRTLERRIKGLELLLAARKLYFNVMEWKRQEDALAEERRRKADEAAEVARAEREARQAAEDAARPKALPVEPCVEPRTPPPPPPPEPKPPPWTYDPPPEMQIRPVSWRRAEPYDDGSEDNYGWTIHEYDPLAAEYDDDS